MKEYPKISCVYKRSDDGKREILNGVYAMDEFKALENHRWIGEEKIDGSNVRIGWNGYSVSIMGRTNDAGAQISTRGVNKLRDRQEKIRLIALMKRTGRKKREECRKLKKQASLMQFVAKETAESNAIIFSRMIALRNALGEIYVQCSKNTLQQRRVRHILKKHGVFRCRKSLE